MIEQRRANAYRCWLWRTGMSLSGTLLSRRRAPSLYISFEIVKVTTWRRCTSSRFRLLLHYYAGPWGYRWNLLALPFHASDKRRFGGLLPQPARLSARRARYLSASGRQTCGQEGGSVEATLMRLDAVASWWPPLRWRLSSTLYALVIDTGAGSAQNLVKVSINNGLGWWPATWYWLIFSWSTFLLWWFAASSRRIKDIEHGHTMNHRNSGSVAKC